MAEPYEVMLEIVQAENVRLKREIKFLREVLTATFKATEGITETLDEALIRRFVWTPEEEAAD